MSAHGAPVELLAAPALARAADPGIENLLPARVVGHDPQAGTTRLELDDGPTLSATLAAERPPGARVLAVVRAEDVIVGTGPPPVLSARNVVPATVLDVARTGVDVTLRCAPTERGRAWLVRLTPAAVASLELRAGTAVWLAVKSHSIRLL